MCLEVVICRRRGEQVPGNVADPQVYFPPTCGKASYVQTTSYPPHQTKVLLPIRRKAYPKETTDPDQANRRMVKRAIHCANEAGQRRLENITCPDL